MTNIETILDISSTRRYSNSSESSTESTDYDSDHDISNDFPGVEIVSIDNNINVYQDKLAECRINDHTIKCKTIKLNHKPKNIYNLGDRCFLIITSRTWLHLNLKDYKLIKVNNLISESKEFKSNIKDYIIHARHQLNKSHMIVGNEKHIIRLIWNIDGSYNHEILNIDHSDEFEIFFPDTYPYELKDIIIVEKYKESKIKVTFNNSIIYFQVSVNTILGVYKNYLLARLNKKVSLLNLIDGSVKSTAIDITNECILLYDPFKIIDINKENLICNYNEDDLFAEKKRDLSKPKHCEFPGGIEVDDLIKASHYGFIADFNEGSDSEELLYHNKANTKYSAFIRYPYGLSMPSVIKGSKFAISDDLHIETKRKYIETYFPKFIPTVLTKVISSYWC